MGNRVRINDVATRLSRAAPRPVPIVYTGLRPGEKLHETLLSENEVVARTIHPLVWHVEVPPLAPSHLRTCALAPGSSALISALRSLAYSMATDAAEHREPLRAGTTINL
jgi:FlaA1/EpsC-like NDP-sugar epimerase